MNENLKGYYLNKTGDRVKQLLDRQFIVPTLDNVPDTKTRYWLDDEYTVEFRIGELCRTSVNGEWVFYRLYDIVNDECVWQKANATEMPNLSDYATKDDLKNAIDEIPIPDINGINNRIEEVAGSIPTKVSLLENDNKYLTEHLDISHLATKNDLEEVWEEIESKNDLMAIELSEVGEMILTYGEETNLSNGYISDDGELVLEFNFE